MKLKYKLFINFAFLFFITINMFAYLLIQYTFNSRLQKTITSCLKEYSVIYSNITTGENLNNLLISDEEILKMKSTSYLSNLQNNTLLLQFRYYNNNLIYSSKDITLPCPKSLFDFNIKDDNNNVKYIVLNDHNSKYIVLNKLISFNKSKIFFTYSNDVTNLWDDRHDNYILLLKFNIVFGLLLLVTIYIISLDITYPINILINNIDEVIKENYSTDLYYHSDIIELNTISENFTHMNNEIQNKFNLLEEQNESKQRFIENLTHEIKTPLTSIIGYSSLILEKNITDINIINNSLRKIHTEGKRIESLTTNLIKIITLDKDSLTLIRISIHSILKEIESIFKIRLSENNIKFKIIGNDFFIDIDKDLFVMLISNFLDNSIKAVLSCQIKEISFILKDNTLIIKDTGVGISSEDISKIFEPFYMVNKSRKRSINGFGLGLSICEKLIQLFNINFDIKSELNKGTQIILSFSKEMIS